MAGSELQSRRSSPIRPFFEEIGRALKHAPAAKAPDAVDLFIAQYLRCVNDRMCPECERYVEFEQRGIHIFGSCGHQICTGILGPIPRRRRSHSRPVLASAD